MRIRHAKAADIGYVVAMGESFFDESGYASVTTWDRASFLHTVCSLLAAEDGSLLVAEQHGQIVGMAGSVVFPFFMNHGQKIGQELFWWVSPDYRTGIGSALLDELEADAKRKGADVFMSAQIAGQRDEAFKRLYMRRGYRAAENSFMRNLNS